MEFTQATDSFASARIGQIDFHLPSPAEGSGTQAETKPEMRVFTTVAPALFSSATLALTAETRGPLPHNDTSAP